MKNYCEMGLIKRHEDMSPDGKLVLCVEPDGDIIIGIEPREESQIRMMPSVEFCNLGGGGGGRSPNVRKALECLIEAIIKDNKENPIESLPPADGKEDCKCNMTQSVLGDGCDICNPEMAEEIRKENEAEDMREAEEKMWDAMQDNNPSIGTYPGCRKPDSKIVRSEKESTYKKCRCGNTLGLERVASGDELCSACDIENPIHPPGCFCEDCGGVG